MQTAPPTQERNRYLIVRLGAAEFGIDVMQVREIAAPQPVTAVPSMPRAMKGVINLHGRVLPLMDLRVRLGMTETSPTHTTCLVVLAGRQKTMAALVDEVTEVLRLSREDTKTVLDVEELFPQQNERSAA